MAKQKAKSKNKKAAQALQLGLHKLLEAYGVTAVLWELSALAEGQASDAHNIAGHPEFEAEAWGKVAWDIEQAAKTLGCLAQDLGLDAI